MLKLMRTIKNINDPVVLYLEKVGEPVELLLHVEDLYRYPATDLGDPTITQGRSLSYEGERIDPLPTPEGDFDLSAFKQELVLEGRAVKLTFVVPDKQTDIGLTTHCYYWNNRYALRGGAYYGAKNRFHKLSVEIYPMPEWEEFVSMVS